MTEEKSQISNRVPKGPSAKKASQTKVASEFAALLKQARDVKTVEPVEGSAEEKDALSSGTLARVKNISKERRSAKDVQEKYGVADKQSKDGTCDAQETDSSNDTGEESEDDEKTTYENLKKAPPEKNASQDKKLAAEFSHLLAQARTSKKGESSASEEDILDEKEVMSKGTVARVKHISNMRRINSIKVKDKKSETPEKKSKDEKYQDAKTNENLDEKSSGIIKDDHLSKHNDKKTEKIAKREQQVDKENPTEKVMKKRTAPRAPEQIESMKSPIVKDKISPQKLMKDSELKKETNSEARQQMNTDKTPDTATKKREAPKVLDHSKSQLSHIETERISLQQLMKNSEAKNEKNNKDEQLGVANNTSEKFTKKRPAPKLMEQNKLQHTTSLKKTTSPHQIKEDSAKDKQEVDTSPNPIATFKRTSLKKSPAPLLPEQNKLPHTTPLKKNISPHQIKEKSDSDNQEVDTLTNPIESFKIPSFKKTTSPLQIKEESIKDKQEVVTLPNPVANFKTTSLKKTPAPKLPEQNKLLHATTLKKTTLPHQIEVKSDNNKQKVDTLSNPETNFKIISLKKTTAPHQIKEKSDNDIQEVITLSNPVANFKTTSLKKSSSPLQISENSVKDKQEVVTLPNIVAHFNTASLKKTKSPLQIKEESFKDKQEVVTLPNPVANFKTTSLKKTTPPPQIKENSVKDKQEVITLPNPVANLNTTSLKKTKSPLQIKEESFKDKQEVVTLPNPAAKFKITSLKKTSPLQNKENSVKDKQEVDTVTNPADNSKIIKQLYNASTEKISCSSDEDKTSKLKCELDNIMTKDENKIFKKTEVVLKSFNKNTEYYLIQDDKPTELEEHMKLIRSESRRASEDLRGFNKKNILKEENRRSSLVEIFQIKLDKETRSEELNVTSRILDESSREVQRKALKELHNQARHHTHPECAYGNMIPEPDYSDDEQAEANTKSSSAIVNRNNTFNNAISKDPLQDRFDEKGLIIPKKLVNPNLEASEKKSLHRELKFNAKAVFEEKRQTRGVNVLNQKTELQKALEKQKDKKAVKVLEVQRKEELTPLQKAMNDRAQKIEKETEKTDNKNSENDKNSSEFEKVHAKLRGKMEV